MRKLRLVPPIYFLAGLGLMLLLNRYLPLARIIPEPFDKAAAVPMLISLLLAVWAIGSFLSRGTTVHPHGETSALVTGGIYRISRNPMYLSLVLLLIGIALKMGSLTPFLVPPALIWILRRQFIDREESRLHDLFGEEYAHYRKKVRRWI